MAQKLLIGLGNPGLQYKMTRHNIGFVVIDMLAERYGCNFAKYKQHGHLATFSHGDDECILFKPTTYMNLSGVAVASVLTKHKIALDDVYVIHDDLEVRTGVVRMQNSSGVHGHNGLRSINSHVGVGYWKIRMGIGRPVDKSVNAYVLEKMSEKDFIRFCEIGNRIADGLTLLFEPSKQGFLDHVNSAGSCRSSAS